MAIDDKLTLEIKRAEYEEILPQFLEYIYKGSIKVKIALALLTV